MLICGEKLSKIRLGFAAELDGLAAPLEAHRLRVQGLVRKHEPLPLLGGQAVFNQRQVEVFIPAVEFVADYRVAEVGEMDANLVLSTGQRSDAEEREFRG